MDGITLLLIFVALGIGVLIGLLVPWLRTQSEQISELPANNVETSDIPVTERPSSPPQPGLKKVGVIWEDKKNKLFFEFDGELISAAQYSQKTAPPPPEADAPTPQRDLVTPAPPPLVEEKQFSSLSIVEQVEDILQGLLFNSPLRKKEIHLSGDTKTGMKVWIGKDTYNTVEEVADPEIRKIIKQAVENWENKIEVN